MITKEPIQLGLTRQTRNHCHETEIISLIENQNKL
jgi:hypothetical protein